MRCRQALASWMPPGTPRCHLRRQAAPRLPDSAPIPLSSQRARPVRARSSSRSAAHSAHCLEPPGRNSAPAPREPDRLARMHPARIPSHSAIAAARLRPMPWSSAPQRRAVRPVAPARPQSAVRWGQPARQHLVWAEPGPI